MDERKPGLGRRKLLATAGAAAAALAAAGLPVINTGSAALGEGKLRAEPLIPPKRRGIILYSVRDRIQAAPDNSGVPYGFERVLAHLATVGYKEVEFAGYTQHTSILGRQITPAEIRKILDDNGLVANGTHTNINPSTLDAEMDIAQTLGMPHIGTGGDPSGSQYQADWDRAVDDWNAMGARAQARGLKLYTHNHDTAYDFLLDAGPFDSNGRPTHSTGIRKLEYFIAKTDPELVYFEMDLLWAYLAQHRFKQYTNANGNFRTDIFDPILTVANRTRRFPLFHAKDGDHTATGYAETPLGEGDINFQQFFQTIGLPDYHHANYEMDDAQLGGSADPGKSLRVAQQSYDNMSALSIYTR
ncbi:sugar phosphate isomerase/epimerase family protein [Actinoplanes sp. NPDC049265]|uniref:sugar phosphate isomerase/epimerase family protein n=1 Tax=Actinoplanes sp. NPDC049265 TaxID=3363902 RepID=UPI00371E929C